MDSLSANSIFVVQNDGTYPAQKRGKPCTLKIFREQGGNSQNFLQNFLIFL